MSRWWYPGTAPKESRPWIIEWRDGKGFVRNDGRQTSISTSAGMGNFGGVLYLLTSGISSHLCCPYFVTKLWSSLCKAMIFVERSLAKEKWFIH